MGQQGASMNIDKKPSPIGQVLAGSYKVERLIGEGGMGAVYKATHARLPRQLAIKILDPKVASHPQAMDRFMQEAWVTNGLRHPHIVNVCDFNTTDDGMPYYVMELLNGEDLETRIRREGPLPLPVVSAILNQITSALDAAHNRGVVHRDLKPQNIYLTRHGDSSDHVKILDFSISKVCGGSGLTEQSHIIGTPYYMAPEQARGQVDRVDRRTDIFAVGLLLYEMITGRQAFVGDKPDAVLYQVVHEMPPPIRSWRPEIPEEMAAVVNRAMAKEQEERYPDMRTLALEFTLSVGAEVSREDAVEMLARSPDDLEMLEEHEFEIEVTPAAEASLQETAMGFESLTPGAGENPLDEDVTTVTVPASWPAVSLIDDSMDDEPTRPDRPEPGRLASASLPREESLLDLPGDAFSMPAEIDLGASFPGEASTPPPAAMPPSGQRQVLMTTERVERVDIPGQAGRRHIIMAAVGGAAVAALVIIGWMNWDAGGAPVEATALGGQVRPRTEALEQRGGGGPPVVDTPPPVPPGITPAPLTPHPAPVETGAEARPPEQARIERDRGTARRKARRALRPAPARAAAPSSTASRSPRIKARPNLAALIPSDEGDSEWPENLEKVQRKAAQAARTRAGAASVRASPSRSMGPLKVPRDRLGDEARGRRLFRDRCGKCHGASAPSVKPSRHTMKQWSRYFRRGKHFRRAPLAGHITLPELADVKSFLISAAADSGLGGAAGLR